jgi:putative pyruvate formate lyase activating enzyme
MNLARKSFAFFHKGCPLHVTQTFKRHRSYLSPPFLLDSYTPRYQLISSVDAAKKRSLAYAHLRNCNLCPRLCGVNRYEKTGLCLIGADTVKVGTVAPHFGEGMCLKYHKVC